MHWIVALALAVALVLLAILHVLSKIGDGERDIAGEDVRDDP